MTENSTLSHLANTIIDTCVRCGKCKATCPTCDEGISGKPRWEIFSGRGRVRLAQGLLDGKIPLTDTIVKSFYTCFFCNSCVENCPSGTKVTELIRAVRCYIASKGKQPQGITSLACNLDSCGDIFGMGGGDRLMWALNVEDKVQARINIPAKVLYFVGCQESFKGSLAEIPEDLVLTLLHLGVDFTLLGEKELCCGNPYLLAGDETKCFEQVEKNIATISSLRASTVIFTCPGCLNTFQKYEKHRKTKLPFNIRFALEFLRDLLASKKLKFPGNAVFGTAVYHDPCELGRHLGIYEAPRAILKAIPNLTLLELDKTRENAMCCGGGGLVGACDKDFSVTQAQRKIIEVLGKQPALLVTSCPACFDTLEGAKGTLEQAQPLKIKDIFKVIAEALNLSP
ncbi:MAG: Fe-S oxidoreductase [Promethearchaeota archaeon CR_4]|nr:MAG: Fe-S oxidoreductase [Candidatus Lokiarchaeota archaeon CR_4]